MRSTQYRVDASDLAYYLHDNALWIEVYKGLNLGFNKALDDYVPNRKKKSKDYCPLHTGKSGEAFSLYPDADRTGGALCNSCGYFKNGYSLVMAVTGWSFPKMLEAIAIESGYLEGALTGDFKKPEPNPERERELQRRKEAEAAQAARLRDKVKQLWEESFKLDAAEALPARLYFKGRGITMPLTWFGDEVRYHPNLPYWHKEPDQDKPTYLGEFPAFLSKIRDASGKPCNLHQTYISLEGKKADVPSPKKMRARIADAPISGGGLQLCPPTPLIGVGEGIETVASVMTARGIPMWGLLNAGMMGSWIPPVGTKVVFGWEDADEAGRKSGAALARRLLQLGVRYIAVNPLDHGYPQGMDWNDILLEHGAAAFPLDDWETYGA